MNSVAILERNPSLLTPIHHPFLQELIYQFRQQDQEKIYGNWSDEQLLDSLLSSSRKRKHRSLMELGISAFYHAITVKIEKATGKLSQIFVHFSQQGLGSVVICCGCLLLISESFQRVSEFSFDSLESLILKGEELIFYGLAKIHNFF